MRSNMKKGLFALIAVGVAFAALPMQASANATIVVVNVDGPGEGFNDASVRAPIGGNAGTTVGQQRLIAFQKAADLWGATLDSPMTIRIQAAFNPLTCSATSAVLGSAGAAQIWSDFANAPFQSVWYHGALADKLAREDLDPTAPHINAQFNSSIGTVPGCLTGSDWYYGLDANHGTNFDLVTVLLHEFGHGLGFSSFISRSTGAYLYNGLPGVYDLYIHDNSTTLDWTGMTNAERLTSMKNSRNVVWTGATVTSQVPSVLSLGVPLMTISAPAAIAGVYPVGTAAGFGPALSSPGVTGSIVQALDAANPAGVTTTDGCTALTNAADVSGKIALVDRGTCGFTVKAANVQAAGAIAMVVADNVAGNPPPDLGGADPTITIPAVRVTLAVGNSIKAQLAIPATVTANLGRDMTRRAGADAANHAQLNMPDPIVSGSSVSHWDPITFRNQLMEPAINPDLTRSLKVPEDLTLSQMRDVGWYADADVDGVPDSSDTCPGTDGSPMVVIDGCQTGVANTTDATGCASIMDGLNACDDNASSHRDYTRCVAVFVDQLKAAGRITAKGKLKIQSCAAGADIP